MAFKNEASGNPAAVLKFTKGTLVSYGHLSESLTHCRKRAEIDMVVWYWNWLARSLEKAWWFETDVMHWLVNLDVKTWSVVEWKVSCPSHAAKLPQSLVILLLIQLTQEPNKDLAVVHCWIRRNIFLVVLNEHARFSRTLPLRQSEYITFPLRSTGIIVKCP